MLRIDGVLIEPIGQRDKVCPACGAELKRFPARTTKCSHCGSPIYLRAEPYDWEKRLFSPAQIADLSLQWSKVSALSDLLKSAEQSPLLLAMYEDLNRGRRGEAWVDSRLLMAYFGRHWSEMMEEWRDPPPRPEPPKGTIVDVRMVMTEREFEHADPTRRATKETTRMEPRFKPNWKVIAPVAAVIGLFVVLGSWGGSAPPADHADVPVSNVETAAVEPSAPRFDPVAIEAMKKQLLAEPKIKDLVFDATPSSVEWQVGVYDDGSSRIGYAGYVCQLLQAKGLVDAETDVRIVDVVKARSNGAFRDASLGHVACTTDQDLGV